MLGMNDEVPPAVPGAFEEFATRLAGDELHRLITTAEPVTDPNRFRIGRACAAATSAAPGCRRGSWPSGLALLLQSRIRAGHDDGGDDAIWLRTCLESGVDGLTSRYFKGVTTIVDVPWAITVGTTCASRRWPARARGASRSSTRTCPACTAPRRSTPWSAKRSSRWRISSFPHKS